MLKEGTSLQRPTEWWVSYASWGDSQPRVEWLLQTEERWNLPGFGLLPWGQGGWMQGQIHHLLVHSLKRPPLLLCILKQLSLSSIPSWGAHQPYSCLHFPSSHPRYLSLLSLDSLNVRWFCQHIELQWQKGTGRSDAWLAAARFLLSEHYPSLMSWNSPV